MTRPRPRKNGPGARFVSLSVPADLCLAGTQATRTGVVSQPNPFGIMPLVFALLMAGEFRVGADIVERPGEDGHDDRARARAADLVVEIVPLGCRDEPDNQPDNQDYRPNSHDGLSFLAAF